MNATEDTEITLGMGRMLVLFFSLVALCAVFFGLGYKMGRGSPVAAASDQVPMTQTNGGVRPSATRTTAASPDDTTASKLDDSSPDKQPPSPSAQSSSKAASSAPAPATASAPTAAELAAASAAASYFVQVAAVSKQEDADALVDALKRKQYVALATSTPTDKLFHVQVGPFSDIREAEAMRTRLMNDGYNPILKK